MYSSPFRKNNRSKLGITLALVLQALMLTLALAVTASGQRPGVSQPARDMVLAIGRKEMDRLLLLKPLPPLSKDPARRAVLRQIGEDFRELQSLNNKMMAQAWSQPILDYRYVSDMISQIRGKATRLKINLSFPEVSDEEPKQSDAKFSDHEKFRAGLLLLDRRIMSFATNPLFQKPDVVEVDLANKASRDLEVVIELSAKLRKEAAALGKTAKTTQ